MKWKKILAVFIMTLVFMAGGLVSTDILGYSAKHGKYQITYAVPKGGSSGFKSGSFKSGGFNSKSFSSGSFSKSRGSSSFFGNSSGKRYSTSGGRSFLPIPIPIPWHVGGYSSFSPFVGGYLAFGIFRFIFKLILFIIFISIIIRIFRRRY